MRALDGSRTDPILQGARARSLGRPKEACPYARASEERTAWIEGYDGMPRDPAPTRRPRRHGASLGQDS
ncbi:Rmf/CrpP family protein [uncultured Methylobacterium sp.]|uniref:ribosome modulation factor n=1 Tax=uncultured Methylobacterium sp. TaxID=157278 RepID=UPI0035CA26D2